MTDNPWLWAAVAIAVGLLIGEIGGSIVRSLMGRRERSPLTRQHARSTASGVFWASVAAGAVIAAGILDRDELEDFGSLLREGLPRLLLAGVLLIVGYALALALAAAVGQSALKATGVRQVALEKVLKGTILAIAVVVALRVAGVDTTLLVVLFAGLIGAPALAFALLTALGGREVASQVAAGRALRHQLRKGWSLRVEDLVGDVVALHTTFVEVEDVHGELHHLPNGWLLERPFVAGPQGAPPDAPPTA
jgi:hypothetical protein